MIEIFSLFPIFKVLSKVWRQLRGSAVWNQDVFFITSSSIQPVEENKWILKAYWQKGWRDWISKSYMISLHLCMHACMITETIITNNFIGLFFFSFLLYKPNLSAAMRTLTPIRNIVEHFMHSHYVRYQISIAPDDVLICIEVHFISIRM